MKFITISLLTLFAFTYSNFINAEVNVNDIPPSYLGTDREGNEVKLDDKIGKVVVVTFWASWCPPCLKEIPILDAIQKQVGKDQLEVIAVNFKEDRRRYRKLIKKMTEVSVTMTHDKRGSISQKFGVNAIPHMFMVDKTGKVAHVHLGYDETMLNQIVDELNTLLEQQI